MENNTEQAGIYSRSSIEFVTVANEYCGFLELHEQFTAKDFVDKATKLLPLLYLKVSLLPELEQKLEDAPEQFVTEYDYNHVINNIAEKLGEKNDYLEVFHEDMQYSDTPIVAYISENLADIYQDLKNMLQNFELAAEEVMNDSLLLCVENFRTHWGQSLTNALRALHQIHVDGSFEDE